MMHRYHHQYLNQTNLCKSLANYQPISSCSEHENITNLPNGVFNFKITTFIYNESRYVFPNLCFFKSQPEILWVSQDKVDRLFLLIEKRGQKHMLSILILAVIVSIFPISLLVSLILNKFSNIELTIYIHVRTQYSVDPGQPPPPYRNF